MRKISSLCCSITILFSLFLSFNTARAESEVPAAGIKEWTFLVFLNGNNNLDRFGKLNINQMEKVGSTEDINVVVQWASLANRKTQRLYVTKDHDTNKVTSPILQDLGKADMGDWKSLVDFVQWGVKYFPAKHYFIDVWDHGSGWHALRAAGRRAEMAFFNPMDISWDDNTGHSISTQQLGTALTESAKIIGHKIDFYASDACLMAMVEVADEVSDSVDIFGGSEEVEPGAGWPYDLFLEKWAVKPTSSPADVGRMLTEEYVKSYMGGSNGTEDATFSIFDLAKLPELNQAIQNFGKSISSLSTDAQKRILKLIPDTQNFTIADYGDLSDFARLITGAKITGLDNQVVDNLNTALNEFVIVNKTTPSFSKAKGVSIWLPGTTNTFNAYNTHYQKLKFSKNTQWNETLKSLLK